MKKIDKDISMAWDGLWEFLLPKGMTPKERNDLARKAGLKPESVRLAARRRSMNAETLLRLLIAKGVAPSVFCNFPVAESKMPKEDRLWQQLGRSLPNEKKREYATLIEWIESRWEIP